MPKFEIGDKVTISPEATIMRRDARGKQGVIKSVLTVPFTPLTELSTDQDIPDPDQQVIIYEVAINDSGITVEAAESDLIAEQQ